MGRPHAAIILRGGLPQQPQMYMYYRLGLELLFLGWINLVDFGIRVPNADESVFSAVTYDSSRGGGKVSSLQRWDMHGWFLAIW